MWSNGRAAVGPGECSEAQSRSGGLLRVRRDFLPNLRDKRGMTERKQFEGRRRDCLNNMCVYMDVGIESCKDTRQLSEARYADCLWRGSRMWRTSSGVYAIELTISATAAK